MRNIITKIGDSAREKYINCLTLALSEAYGDVGFDAWWATPAIVRKKLSKSLPKEKVAEIMRFIEVYELGYFTSMNAIYQYTK